MRASLFAENRGRPLRDALARHDGWKKEGLASGQSRSPRPVCQGRCGEAPVPGSTLGVTAVGADVDAAGDGVAWGVQTTRSSKT